ncbi:MAG: CDP-alcohol phosphatidyltransferase family protein [Pseudomonadota bacterium]|nr:CDP-alcohol phosphatidyltransferase family protein [Pseudomonadota bacterium]
MSKDGIRINIPNLISLIRLLCVPMTVWLIINNQVLIAFWVFVFASISDALDGFIAKRFNLQTELGAYLDPIADKALLVSVFITLGQAGYLNSWLVLLVVFRDSLILVGAFLYHLIHENLTMEPLLISKINTAAQFFLVTVVLGLHGYSIVDSLIIEIMVYVVAVTSIISGAAYVGIWGMRAANMESGGRHE